LRHSRFTPVSFSEGWPSAERSTAVPGETVEPGFPQ
jgi:hypothetical protein